MKVLEPPPDERPKLPDHLLTLVGRYSAVQYTAGSLDRAQRVLDRLDAVASKLNRWTEMPVAKAVYLLDRSQWKEAELPGLYGVPLPLGQTAIVVPAAGDQATVRLWRRVLGVDVLPMIPGVPLRGTPEEAATLAIADLLLQIESGRAMVERSELRPDRIWIAELAAHAAALSLVVALEEHRLAEINATLSRVTERLGGPGAYSLESYSPALLFGDEDSIKHWLWAQGAFNQAAAIIVARDRKQTVPRLLKLATARQARGLSWAALVERYPALEAWHARFWPSTEAPP